MSAATPACAQLPDQPDGQPLGLRAQRDDERLHAGDRADVEVENLTLGPAEFGELFGSRGISNDHTIVLYGDRNNWFAAYTYWYLKYYGHDNVKLMNGPREKWISEGRPTSSGRAELRGAELLAQEGDARDPRDARRGARGARQQTRAWWTCARRRSSPAS